MGGNLKKVIALVISLAVITIVLPGCGGRSVNSSSTSSSGTVTITYAIWDKNQEPGMKAIADVFHKKYPNITVKVEVTPWDQYWTKMDAAATGGSLPDVFWMHSNNFVKYASNGMLMDITSRIKSSKLLDMNKFPKGLVDLYTFDGKNYAIPKDYDTIALWYNKTMFDAAKIPYPDDSWDWNKLLEVARKLTNPNKGVYGFVAPEDAQQGYYNFIYQNGGYVISPDGKTSGWSLPATKEAIQWDVDLSTKYHVSPTQDQFAQTSFAQYFEAGKAAMGLFGSWMVSEFDANSYVKKNCDVAVIPKGKQRATIYNGLGNVISAKTKYPEQSWKFLEFLGTQEANMIQAKYGSAIPAYEGTQQGWIDHFKNFNVKVYPEMLSYGVLMPHSKTASKWQQIENDILKKVWMKQLSVDEGCNQLAQQVNALLATEK
ncbi:ABC transporter substrate-binding protein [Caldanaerobius polysaccharolyticus]|uniref:ABC transporter substrate-binding protein n=1 Tax=Caldanaerobius polysaccharolyticus TaxID=44256 RepID=UPI00047EDCAD|nr:sugar ABC transporter substrate-binding protein [Caldanaerobius polysaccharolyticus]